MPTFIRDHLFMSNFFLLLPYDEILRIGSFLKNYERIAVSRECSLSSMLDITHEISIRNWKLRRVKWLLEEEIQGRKRFQGVRHLIIHKIHASYHYKPLSCMRLLSITFRQLDVIRLKKITALINRRIFPVSLSKLSIHLDDNLPYLLDLSEYSLFWETLSTHSPVYYKCLTTIDVFYNTLIFHSNKEEISSIIVPSSNNNSFLSHIEHLSVPLFSTEVFKKIVHFIISGGFKSLKLLRFSFGFCDNFLYSPSCMDDYMTLKSHRPNLMIHISFTKTMSLKDNVFYPFFKKIIELELPTSHSNLFKGIQKITHPDDISFHMQSSMILKNLLDQQYFNYCLFLYIEIDFRSYYRNLGSYITSKNLPLLRTIGFYDTYNNSEESWMNFFNCIQLGGGLSVKQIEFRSQGTVIQGLIKSSVQFPTVNHLTLFPDSSISNDPFGPSVQLMTLSETFLFQDFKRFEIHVDCRLINVEHAAAIFSNMPRTPPLSAIHLHELLYNNRLLEDVVLDIIKDLDVHTGHYTISIYFPPRRTVVLT